jgi:putative ABC transport system ATP-binding protein
LLEARGVSKWLGRSRAPALRDITLSIPAGSWTLITGPSGSGKTTLLSLLGALDRPSEGQVLFEGEDLSDYSDLALARVRRRMSFIFQDFGLIPRLPVWENVTYPLVPRGVAGAARRKLAKDVLARVGLAGYEERPPEELSGGERQRVAAARAMAANPTVVFADEPTSHLDSESAELVWQALASMHSEGVTVVVSSHAPDPLRTQLTFELRRGELVSGAGEGKHRDR